MVIKILPVQRARKIKNDTPRFSKKFTFVPRRGTDRRKRSLDRRYSVRNGVHVRLTFKTDRRRGIDRRKLPPPRLSFRTLSLHSGSG